MTKETSGNSLSAVALENALLRCGSQKKVAIELGVSEGELSKQIASLRKSIALLDYLGLRIVEGDLDDALRRLLKEAL